MARVRIEEVTKRFGETVALDAVSLDIADGEFFAILGPPGAGKTTLLRTIGGLEKPDHGDIYLDHERVTSVFPGERNIAIMFQNLALYPDKTVFGNLAFPLRQAGIEKDQIRRRVTDTAETLHIGHLLERKPGKLSGGERQRVALGRALVREPRVFLLDEPLSALDALLRLEMRSELKHIQRDLGGTLVYVTHDQVEAMTMPDRLAILREGVIQQVDAPEEVYHRPSNRFVAGILGSPAMNLLDSRLASGNGSVRIQHPSFEFRCAEKSIELGTTSRPAGSECSVGVRPEDVEVSARLGRGIPAEVYGTEPLGAETVVDLRINESSIKALAPATVRFTPGQRVSVSFNLRKLHIFDESGNVVLSSRGADVLEWVSP